MTKPLIYLASPYWHEQEVIRLTRANMVKKKTAELMENGYVVFSPICHAVNIAPHLPAALRNSHDFWMGIDLPILRVCAEFWVLTLHEWQLSVGITRELEEAKLLHKPIRYIEYVDPTLGRNPNSGYATEENLRPGAATAARGLD